MIFGKRKKKIKTKQKNEKGTEIQMKERQWKSKIKEWMKETQKTGKKKTKKEWQIAKMGKKQDWM